MLCGEVLKSHKTDNPHSEVVLDFLQRFQRFSRTIDEKRKNLKARDGREKRDRVL